MDDHQFVFAVFGNDTNVIDTTFGAKVDVVSRFSIVDFNGPSAF